MKMIVKTSTRTMEASEEDRRHVQGIGDDNIGGSGSITGPMDWQQQRSTDFLCDCVANSNTVSSLSRRCLFLNFFIRFFIFVCCKKDYNYCNHVENIFVPSVH